MVTQIVNYDQVDVFVGLDVGTGEHPTVALDRTGKKLYDRPLPNDEKRLRSVLGEICSNAGRDRRSYVRRARNGSLRGC